MKTKNLLAAFALIGALAGPIAACTSTPEHESTGEYIDDSAISNKVRAELLSDKELNVFKIDVTTYKGVVQLSGFVKSTTAKERAGTVARNVHGVKEVRNNLIVK